MRIGPDLRFGNRSDSMSDRTKIAPILKLAIFSKKLAIFAKNLQYLLKLVIFAKN